MLYKMDKFTRQYKIIFISLIFFPLSLFANSLLFPNKNVLNDLKTQGINGRYNEGSCTGDGDNAICTAVGFANNNGAIYPLLVKSIDGGKTFNIDKNITNYSSKGTLLATSCTGSGSNAMCIAGGYAGATSESGTPLLIQSTDGGLNWKKVSVSGLFNFGLFKKVSCSGGDSSSAICIAVGWGNKDQSTDKYPILAQSTDYGKTWTQQSISNLSSDIKGQLYSASCTGEGGYAMCVAIGSYSPYLSTLPILIQTNDGGNTWVNKRFIFYANLRLSFDMTFTDVNCTGGNTNTICTIVGRIGTNDPLFNPLVYQTTDRGNNWIKNSLKNFPVDWNGTVNSINCAGLGNNSFCATAGTGSLKPSTKREDNLTTFPLILQATGDMWSVTALNDPSPDLNTLYATTCVGGINNFCFAAGSVTHNGIPHPLLAATKNLSSWNMMQINDIPSQGLLRSTSCSKTGSICIAVGYSQGNKDVPLIVASNDGAKTWAIKGNNIVLLPRYVKTYACDETKTHCVGVGDFDTSSGHCPLCKDLVSYISDDGGLSWQPSQRIYHPPYKNYLWLNAVSCSSNGMQCVTIGGQMPGGYGSISYDPLILVSKDGGNNWLSTAYPTVDHYPHDEVTVLDGDADGLRWVALGIQQERMIPLSYFSSDGGYHWEFSRQFPPIPNSSSSLKKIELVNCDKHTMQCRAFGTIYDSNIHKEKKITWRSDDAGNNWVISDVKPSG